MLFFGLGLNLYWWLVCLVSGTEPGRAPVYSIVTAVLWLGPLATWGTLCLRLGPKPFAVFVQKRWNEKVGIGLATLAVVIEFWPANLVTTGTEDFYAWAALPLCLTTLAWLSVGVPRAPATPPVGGGPANGGVH